MRTFVELVEKYVDSELCPYPEYKGKPLYSIKYIENGEEYVGYSTYSLRVMSEFLKKYFIPSALEKQEQDRWIPVTERLPEENGTYLACYEDATVLLDWFNGKWFFYRTNPAVEETGTIIAWRPLPDPYTEEES